MCITRCILAMHFYFSFDSHTNLSGTFITLGRTATTKCMCSCLALNQTINPWFHTKVSQTLAAWQHNPAVSRWELHISPMKRFIFSLCILGFSHALWITMSHGTYWNGDRGKCLHTSRKSYILTSFYFEFTNPSIPVGYEEWGGIRPHAYETHREI